MDIIIVGAGIGGLSTSISLSRTLSQTPALQPLKLVLLESAPALAEIGAGVQMAPQAIRTLFEWGMEDDLVASSAIPSFMKVRNGRSGDVIGQISIRHLWRDYEAPYLVVHRGVLHSILHKHAVKAGVEVRTDSRVTDYDIREDRVVVTLADGTKRTADLVIAADGINSFARKQFLGTEDPGTKSTGWAAFRTICPSAAIKADPTTADLLDEDGSSNLWIAHNASCMTYLIKDATMLNIVLSHRDDVDTASWSLEQHREYVGSLFDDFDPRVGSLLDMCLPKIVNYPVFAVPPLPKWSHESGRFTLLGDAVHAMAFYLSMGVSLAVEDAVALGEALRLAFASGQDTEAEMPLKTVSTRLKEALRVFERVRIPRASAIQEASLHAGNILHLPDGPEQDIRDEGLRRCDDYWPPEPQPRQEGHEDERAECEKARRCVYGIADKRTRDWCYGYDAAGAVREAWESRRGDAA